MENVERFDQKIQLRREHNSDLTLWSKQIIHSDIFRKKPDKWFKIWFYLVNKVNSQDQKDYARGCCFMKYKWIMERTGATRSEVDHCIRFLKLSSMIETQKSARGLHLTILNYCLY